MKYVKSFESYREYKKSEKLNEELLGGLINLFKNMWNKATAELKKLGEKPTMAQLDEWVEKNVFNPASPNYLFKNVIDTFKKKADTEINGEACIKLIGDILDPETGALGKQGTQPLYDTLLKAFGKNLAPLNTIKYYFETARNRAIKDYKYGGGPDNGKVDQKKIITDLKDQTHLPDLKKILLPDEKDNKKMKQSTINWVEKTLLPRLLKYIQEIKPEEVNKYLETQGIKGGAEYKVGDNVVYKRDKFDEDKWKSLTDDDKKKPNDGKMKEMVDGEMVGIKKISKIEGDKISFEGADFVKTKDDILMKTEAVEKAEGQDELVNQLKTIKDKNPDDIKKISDITKLFTDPEANKDKIEQIDKTLGL